MRIVDLGTFLGLPDNTLFSKYEPCVFGPLSIKGRTLGRDFTYQQIADALRAKNSNEFCDLCDAACRNGGTLSLDFECEVRDGMFHEEQLFAVWEKADVGMLIARLLECAKTYWERPVLNG